MASFFIVCLVPHKSPNTNIQQKGEGRKKENTNYFLIVLTLLYVHLKTWIFVSLVDFQTASKMLRSVCLSWAPGFDKPRPILLPFCQFYVYATCQAKVSINYQNKKKTFVWFNFLSFFFNKEAPSVWCNWWLTHWDLKKEIADLNCEIRSHFFCKKKFAVRKVILPGNSKSLWQTVKMATWQLIWAG